MVKRKIGELEIGLSLVKSKSDEKKGEETKIDEMNTRKLHGHLICSTHTITTCCLSPGFALIIVVLITGIFSFVQENKETEMRKEFDRLIPEKATVIR